MLAFSIIIRNFAVEILQLNVIEYVYNYWQETGDSRADSSL